MSIASKASFILIPMDETSQKNHLKAYGITYWCLDKNYKASWLLNYRGGSFLLPDAEEIRKECQIRGVSFEIISDGEEVAILNEISSPSQNMES
ncbi:MAG: asparagine synthetase B, partial [Chryseobacterium sp.]|nr:asparagine synthetase B [Chryseobacterium sp.]